MEFKYSYLYFIDLETLLARFAVFSVSKSESVSDYSARGYAGVLCKRITICDTGNYDILSLINQAEILIIILRIELDS